MDFKNILQSLTSLSEGETKETGKGRVHKGSYGTEYDGDDEKKKDAPAVKRGRGRPKKDADASGEVKKYDTKGLHGVFGGGEKPKKDIGKTSKKHSLKEYIEEVADSKSQLDEAEQITIAPAQQNTQVIKQGNKTLGTVTNPQLAQQIKQSIGKGEMSLVGDEVGEGLGDVAKKVGGAIKTGAQAVGKAIVGPDDAELLARLKKDAGVRNPQTGKPSMAISDVTREQANGASAQRKMGKDGDIYEVGAELTEKAPPGEKAERMVKHIKASYAKDGKLTPKEKSIAYATAWKAHNKGKVEESFVYEGMTLTEGAMKDLVTRFLEDLEHGPKGYNIMTAVELKDRAMAQRIIDKLLQHGERYKRLAGTLKGQLRDAALEEFGFTDYDSSLEEADTRPEPELLAPVPSKEAFTTHGMDSKVGNPNAFTPSRTQAPAAKPSALRAAGALANKLNPFKKLGESTEMKDVQLESWEQQLNSMLNEGVTVSSSSGQQGSPDSVSITATDADAQTLMGVLRNAGIGGFGAGEQQPEVGYGVVQGGEEDFDGTGTEPQPSPNVVGDDSDMLDMIKKMAGLSGGEVVAVSGDESDDYEDEEGSDETALQPANDDGEESDEEEKTDEGNAFGAAVAKAKSDGIQKGEKVSVGGKTYPVKEEDMEEGNKFTGNLAKARAAGKEEADLDGDGDMEKVHEGEHTCNECGMMEAECQCDHEQVEENWSNDAGGDAMADTEMAKLKALLAMGNDLNKQKRSQTVGNPTQVAFESQVADWKKLSGIK